MAALLLLFPGYLRAQDLWLRSAGGSNLDEALDIAYTAGGNAYYVAGHFSGSANFGTQSLSSSGLSDGFLAKYDNDGTPLWVKKMGGTASDRAIAVRADNSGNAYVCGYFQQTAQFGSNFLNANDSSDVFVAKYSPEGNLLWVRSAGGSGNDLANGIAVDLSLNVIITGNFRANAIFGSGTLTSMNYAASPNPSSDAFIAKLDQNGNWLWAKKASAPGDEKGMDVCTDNQNNIFFCGQYSGDITFDETHLNTVENAGFVIGCSASGDENWFADIHAGAVLPYAIGAAANGHVYICGENLGQMIFSGNPPLTLPSSYAQSCFLAAYSADGNIQWAQSDGSDSYVSARALAIGSDNEVYLSGIFECVFTEYSEATADGLFNSAGYRDVFTARYNADGSRIWMRQYGGPGEESCNGIARGSESDRPRICGSFESYFHAPGSSAYFQSNTTNFTPGAGDDLESPNPDTELCNFPHYGEFMHLAAVNNKDIFIGNLYHPDLQDYDFYSRDDCSFSQVMPCINDSQTALECAEEMIVCGSGTLHFVSNTGSQNWIGPAYHWQWSNNAFDDYIVVDETGWYWLDVEREDGCLSHRDSIYVEILPVPTPLISDDAGFNTLSPPDATEVQLCAPAAVELEGSNAEGLDGWWTDQMGNTFEDATLTITSSDILQYHVTGDNGCEGVNEISVLLVDPLDEIDPLLQFSEADQPVNDTIVLCGNDFITTEIIDLLDQDDFSIYTDALWQISLDTGYYPPYLGFESYTWSPQVGGWHHISASPFIFAPEPCSPDTIWYPEQTLSVYIVLLDDPMPQPTLSGESTHCPGDTLLLVASNGPNYSWSGPGIIEVLSQDSILVNEPGFYSVTSYEAFENGCESTGLAGLTIASSPQPQITSMPSHHVICPGDSVLLTCQAASDYLWIGPLGQTLGTGPSIWSSASGAYYCLATLDGCTQESNIIELEHYTTPYISTFPASDLCVNGMVSLIIQCDPLAAYSWNSPLTGSSNPVTVFDPGLYTASVDFCSIITEVSVTVIESNPVATISAENDFICPGSSLEIFANPGMTDYIWTPGNDTTASILVTSPGNYQVEIFNEAGCSATSAIFNVEAYTISPPSTGDQSVCYGDALTLNAPGSGVFWTSDEAGDNVISNGSILSLSNLTENRVVYVFSSDANCRSMPNDVSITINPASLASIAAQDSAFCAGESLQLSASDGGPAAEYLWTLPDGTEEEGSALSIMQLPPTLNGWFTLEISDNQCESEPDSIFIVVENPIDSTLMQEEITGVCIGSELMLIGPDGYNIYAWVTPLGMYSGQVLQIESSNFIDEGWYYLSVPGEECGFRHDSMQVDVVEYPDFALNDSSVWCSGGYMTAHIPEGFDLYLWSTGSVLPAAIVPADGFISVTATNLPGCSKTDSIQVSDVYCIDRFPNIFTPGGDSYNDYVDFGWLRIPIDEVLIYNRWGNLIRRIADGPFTWNGTNENNERVSEGVYYYVIISGNPEPWQNATSGYIEVIFDDGGNN